MAQQLTAAGEGTVLRAKIALVRPALDIASSRMWLDPEPVAAYARYLSAMYPVTRAAVPLLRSSHGLVVNIASLAGTIPAPGLAAYGAAKAGVISLTRSLNAELEADGIRATAICPGFVDTPMAAWTAMPSKEMIQPQDCAEVVRLLLRLSPAARIPQVVLERLGSGRF